MNCVGHCEKLSKLRVKYYWFHETTSKEHLLMSSHALYASEVEQI